MEKEVSKGIAWKKAFKTYTENDAALWNILACFLRLPLPIGRGEIDRGGTFVFFQLRLNLIRYGLQPQLQREVQICTQDLGK